MPRKTDRDEARIEEIKKKTTHDCRVCSHLVGFENDAVLCMPPDWKASGVTRIVPRICKCSQFRFDINKVKFD